MIDKQNFPIDLQMLSDNKLSQHYLFFLQWLEFVLSYKEAVLCPFTLMKKSTELFFVVYQTEHLDFQLTLSRKANFILVAALVIVWFSVCPTCSVGEVSANNWIRTKDGRTKREIVRECFLWHYIREKYLW